MLLLSPTPAPDLLPPGPPDANARTTPQPRPNPLGHPAPRRFRRRGSRPTTRATFLRFLFAPRPAHVSRPVQPHDEPRDATRLDRPPRGPGPWTLGGTLAVALGLLATGCHESAPTRATAPTPAPVEIQVAEARPAVHRAVEEVVGTVRARVRVVVEAKVSGRVEELPATPGLAVRKGELLVRLDAREIRARVEQAQAVLQQAERELARFATLLGQEAVTRAEYDAVEARQRVARAALTEAQTMLGDAVIVAPWDGVVTRKLAETGDLAVPGRPLLEIEDPASLRFEADFPESLAGRARVGDLLPVRLASMAQPLEGRVGEIEPTSDPVSRTFRVKLDLPPSAATNVRAGWFGRVSVPAGESTLLAIPSEAVLTRGQLEFAHVIDGDGRARLRLLRTGKQWGDLVEVLAGLEAGERIATRGGSGLVDGQPVTVRPDPAPPAARPQPQPAAPTP